MTTEQTRTLELIGLDVSREVALLLDEMFFRIERLERDNRTLNRLVAALIERDEQHRPAGGVVEVLKGARLVTEMRTPLAQSGAYDPRD